MSSLFSTVVKDAGTSRFSHVQGEVNSLGKLDCHYYMFGFLASKDEGIWIESLNPESLLRIKCAFRWFRGSYCILTFSMNMKPFWFAKPASFKPRLLEE